ncbi:hypothetical protein LCGC14_3153890 [marine sediment metagenome]|uniref:Uncharacterized protein n=1 Tax=marine sediment metagenome TaxID=412755 RepID=A0A0F8VTB2_9ZZZZ
MGKKFRSLLDELDSMIPERDKYTVLESRASHFIQSGINLIKLIEENFSPSEADELTRRLFNSLRGRDPKKFTRKIKQLKESQERDNDK